MERRYANEDEEPHACKRMKTNGSTVAAQPAHLAPMGVRKAADPTDENGQVCPHVVPHVDAKLPRAILRQRSDARAHGNANAFNTCNLNTNTHAGTMRNADRKPTWVGCKQEVMEQTGKDDFSEVQ